MKTERLDAMVQNAVSLDLETDMIQPGLVTPPFVLGSTARVENGKIVGKLLDKKDVCQLFLTVLRDPNIILCLFNGTFDINVLLVHFLKLGADLFPEVFAMYDPKRTIIRGECDGRVFDPMLTEQLHAIAQGHLGADARTGKTFVNPETGRQGRYSLQTTHEQVTGNANAKANDRFRCSYYLFHDVPLEELPFEARTYPIDDAVNTLWDALAQAGHMPSINMHEWGRASNGGVCCVHCKAPPNADGACVRPQRRRNIHDLSRQAYFAFAASHGALWGFKIDHQMVNDLEKKYLDARAAESQPFIDAGIIRADGSENQSVLKQLVAQAYGARLYCKTCEGTGKVPSPKTEGRTKINCKDCDGTTLELPPEVPRSPTGQVAKDGNCLQESGNELLMNYNDQEGDKILSTYIPLMRRARACNFCGEPGSGKRKHKDGCPGDEAGFREVPLLPFINSIVATGRCAVEDGLHGLPRTGGVRECFMARPGYVFSSEDYTAGELVTHAWSCLKLVGYSRLAEALNAGLDAHLALAGTMTGRDYETMKKLKKAGDKGASNDRQAAKAANFGFPGGMAELTFTIKKRSEAGLFTPCENGPVCIDGVRGYKGLRTCILMDGAKRCGEDAWGNNNKVLTYHDKPTNSPVCMACLVASKRLREFWFKQWPENNQKDGYFHIIKEMVKECGPSGLAEQVQHRSGRIRGGVDFCSGATGLFQGLLADAAKNAYCAIDRECWDRTCRVENSEFMTSKYAGGESPLYGSKAIMLLHDEPLIEHPESIAHEAATRASEICVEALRFMCPEMAPAVKAEPTLMRRLYKGAEPRYARGGDKPADELDRLVPWEPKKKAA